MQNERMALRAFSYREKLSQRTRFEEAEAAATFQLPELVRRANVLKVEAVGPAFSSQPPPAGLDVPFDFQMSPRLLVVNFALTAAQFDAPLAGYHLFVMSDVIERRCRGAPGHVVPWDRWASEVRLVQKEPLGLVSDGHLFHTRCILPEAKPRPARDEDDERANSNSDEDADREEAVPLVLYDFAPKHLLRFDALAERFDNVEYVHEPSSVTGPRIWKADSIETGSARPFRKIRTPVEICLETSMFSMTEDCVIYGDETGCVILPSVCDHLLSGGTGTHGKSSRIERCLAGGLYLEWKPSVTFLGVVWTKPSVHRHMSRRLQEVNIAETSQAFKY